MRHPQYIGTLGIGAAMLRFIIGEIVGGMLGLVFSAWFILTFLK